MEKTKHIDNWRWPNFSPEEFACRHCGELFEWPAFMDRIQLARSDVGSSFIILSGHRCTLHNARVGGAPFSQHLKLAADISTLGHNRRILFQACKKAGFTGFGFYQNFLHIDIGPPRMWWSGEKAKIKWQNY